MTLAKQHQRLVALEGATPDAGIDDGSSEKFSSFMNGMISRLTPTQAGLSHNPKASPAENAARAIARGDFGAANEIIQTAAKRAAAP